MVDCCVVCCLLVLFFVWIALWFVFLCFLLVCVGFWFVCLRFWVWFWCVGLIDCWVGLFYFVKLYYATLELFGLVLVELLVLDLLFWDGFGLVVLMIWFCCLGCFWFGYFGCLKLWWVVYISWVFVSGCFKFSECCAFWTYLLLFVDFGMCDLVYLVVVWFCSFVVFVTVCLHLVRVWFVLYRFGRLVLPDICLSGVLGFGILVTWVYLLVRSLLDCFGFTFDWFCWFSIFSVLIVCLV